MKVRVDDSEFIQLVGNLKKMPENTMKKALPFYKQKTPIRRSIRSVKVDSITTIAIAPAVFVAVPRWHQGSYLRQTRGCCGCFHPRGRTGVLFQNKKYFRRPSQDGNAHCRDYSTRQNFPILDRV